jgi:uncharacterized protein
MEYNFEWDEKKRRQNIRKHGLDFRDAWEIFTSPMLIALDDREDYSENRWIGLGMLQSRVVVVLFVERQNDTIRIVSLRKALSYERTEYEAFIENELGTGG